MADAMYMKIDGAPGSSTDSKHSDWIEIEHYSFGGSQQSAAHHGSGGGAGKVSFHPLSFGAKAGKESPVLFQFMCSGEHISKIEIHESKAGGSAAVNHVEIELTDCFMTDYAHSSSHGSPDPNANYSLHFTTAKFKYQEQNDKGGAKGGPTTGGWDAKLNKKM